MADWKDAYVSVNGVQFHYTRTGDGSKPALVLAHGFSDNGMCWLPVARDLEADYDVILPDARGHGLSPRVQPGELVDHAADLAGIIEALGLDRPIIGGHSMGGSTTSMLAASRPELARALILEDPAWFDQPAESKAEKKEPQPNPWHDWLRSLPGLSLEEVMAKGRADSPSWAEIEMPAWAESKKQLDINILQTEGVHRPWREVAEAIRCPTLLITADSNQGGIVTPQIARTAILLNRRVQLANVPGVGHNIRREDYKGYMRAVKEFLSSVD